MHRNEWPLWIGISGRNVSEYAAYYRIGKFDEAVDDFKEAIHLSPNNAKAYGWCGNAYYAKGFYFEASVKFDKAIEIDPSNPIFYLNRGHATAKMGNESMAASDFKKACDLGDEGACKQLRVLGYR